jgi:23S rRNA (uracil1939-C5)-methyltransferase
MPNKNDVIELTIDDLTVEGAGVGRFEGLAVFVPHALPGETVSSKIIKITKSYAVGKLIKILHQSENRVEPFCDVFEACGGCTLQHLSYDQQLAFKARHIKQCFKRIGGIEIPLPEVEPAGNTRDYRNKASFPVAMVNGRAEAGFFAPHSHRLVASDCPIQKQSINDAKNAVIQWANDNKITPYDEKAHKGMFRHIVARQSSNGEMMTGIVLRDWTDTRTLADSLYPLAKSVVVNKNEKKHNAILGSQSRTVHGDGYITEYYDGLKFRVGLTSFLQVNHEQSEKLYRIALDFAKISKEDIVFDLFCGIGTISLLAARQAELVLGIEYVQEAVENANENAKLNNIDNAYFLAGDASQMIDEGIKQYGQPDIVILDPPRKGCDSPLIQKVTAVSPKRIVYVSCNPSTLARDAAVFATSGYKVDKVTGVDLFPQTTHVETVCLLTRKY